MRTALFVLFLPALLAAQVTSSALSGAIHDAAGAAVPYAKVTLTGEENGFVRTVTTSNEGFFSFPDLTPATFTLTVEAAGFKTYRQTRILINADEARSLGEIRLEVGKVSESVTVKAEAVTVDLATGERAGVLSGQQLDEIALRGRDLFDAVSLMAGVIDTSDGRDSPSPSSISNIYIMGGRNDQKNMTVDGVTNLDTGSNGSVHSMPSVDSVAEVKVLMSAYSAENGRNPFAINVITKGGTTQYHGSAAYYFRNEDLNANDFFANSAGKPRAEYRYNIASYTFGGPVVLPKLHQLSSRLFFFFSQEFQRQVQNYGVKEVTVPTQLEREGNFSQSFTSTGSLIKVNDPLNNKTQFPGNIIPPSRLTPIGQAILNLFPLPNFHDSNPLNQYQWNYYANSSEPYPRRTETARVDYSPKDNWQLYLSLSNNADSQNVPYSAGTAGWVAGSLNFPLVPIAFQQPGRLATLHSTNSISASTFNEASLAASQNTLMYSPLNPSAVDRTALGITLAQRNPTLNVLNAIPDMSLSGNIANPANPSMSDGVPYFNRNTILSFFDNVSRVHGTHSYKMGVYYEHNQKLQSASSQTRGSVSFNTDGNNPLDSNHPYANALLGNYDSYSEATGRPQGNFKYMNLEWFVQDTWRVKRNLSLDYGIRLYHDPPQFDSRGQLSSFAPGAYSLAAAPELLRPVKVNGTNYAQNPVTGELLSNGLVGDFAPGVGNLNDGILIGGRNGVPNGLFHIAPVAFAPRFGFSWDPFGNGKTAIRGGGGVYLDRIQGNPVMNLLQQPAYFSPAQYYGTFSDIAASASTGYLSPSGTTYSLASAGHQQLVYNFNLQIQRELTRSDMLMVGYAGSLGQHLLWERNINAIPLGATFLNLNPQNQNPQNTSALPNNFLKPFQGFGTIYLYEFANNSNYHSLQASILHRLARGFNLSANYTLSKALDCSDAYSSAVDPFLDPRSRNYGPASYDRRHVFSSNFYWNLPAPGRATGARPLGWIADGWAISGVVRMATGGPVTPSYSLVNGIASPSGSPDDTARPQVVNPDAPLGPVISGGAITTTTRFGPPPEPANQAKVPWVINTNTPQLGNLGKNTLYGPGVNNWDLSLYRVVKLSERVSSQFRLESYNTFNHTQWSTYNTSLQFNSAGTMVNTAFDTPNAARPPRRVQIAVRLSF
jgi:Carboxypeptidase regulatory-like domain